MRWLSRRSDRRLSVGREGADGFSRSKGSVPVRAGFLLERLGVRRVGQRGAAVEVGGGLGRLGLLEQAAKAQVRRTGRVAAGAGAGIRTAATRARVRKRAGGGYAGVGGAPGAGAGAGR